MISNEIVTTEEVEAEEAAEESTDQILHMNNALALQINISFSTIQTMKYLLLTI